jgi:hypothetical protein
MGACLWATLLAGAGQCQAPAAGSGQPGQTQSDNPFPEEPGKTKAQNAPQAGEPSKPGAANENPFPGEDPNAPIIPVPGGSSPYSGNGDAQPRRPLDDTDAPASSAAPGDGDPVKSPDGQGNVEDDRFSSSRDGLKPDLAESATDKEPGSSVKAKTREQVIKEDLDVGGFYLSKKDWKGALSRFASAFQLDSEDPDAVWGMAEAERHLQLYAKSAEHYKLFLSYDPDGPHSREARKSLQQVEGLLGQAASSPK